MLEMGKKYGKPETLAVTGHLLKGRNVISLHIVRGSCVAEVHELLQPDGRCAGICIWSLDQPGVFPTCWEASPWLYCTSAAMGAEQQQKLSCIANS